MADHVIAYAGGELERFSAQRGDAGWISSLLANPRSQLLPMWRDRCLRRAEDPGPLLLAMPEATEVLAASAELVFLGCPGAPEEGGVFAADLSSLEEPLALARCRAVETTDIRRVGSEVRVGLASTLAHARGLLFWHRQQQFCGRCGGATESRSGGHVRVCRTPSCGKQLFPWIEPCVIVLVRSPGSPERCLLGRHRGAAEGVYSTLAGFVEVGESLEDTVRREVFEEAGVAVEEVRYQCSQPWPFPSGLMVGFFARAVLEDLTVDPAELVEARWFTRAEVATMAAERGERRLFNDDSIEKVLIERWMQDPT